jgi:hypothetical protein
MSLKMAALCLDASLETLRPLCCPHAPSPVGSMLLPSQGISSGSPGCCDAFGTPCPPKHPTQPIVYCSGGWGLHCPRTNSRCWWRPLRSHSWVVLALWAGAESCWKTHFRPLTSTWRDSSPKQPSLQPSRLVASSCGLLESCNRTYGRTRYSHVCCKICTDVSEGLLP